MKNAQKERSTLSLQGIAKGGEKCQSYYSRFSYCNKIKYKTSSASTDWPELLIVACHRTGFHADGIKGPVKRDCSIAY